MHANERVVEPIASARKLTLRISSLKCLGCANSARTSAKSETRLRNKMVTFSNVSKKTMLCGIPAHRFQIRNPLRNAAELPLLLRPLQTVPTSTSHSLHHYIPHVGQPTRGAAGIGVHSRTKTPLTTMVSLSMRRLYSFQLHRNIITKHSLITRSIKL